MELPESLEKLKYPIGIYQHPGELDRAEVDSYIDEIEQLPSKLREETGRLSDIQLETPYRPGGWTIRQVVHHIADSHLHSYTRFKLALTETVPRIKPYYEERWAELKDGKNASISISIQLIGALHKRWIFLLRNLSESDLARQFVHPEHETSHRLDETIAMYAWHGNHHLAHIQFIKHRMQWQIKD